MSRIKECSISIYEDRYIDGYDEITQQAANVLDSFTLTNIFNHTQIRFTQRFVLSKWLTPEQRQIMYNKFVDEILFYTQCLYIHLLSYTLPVNIYKYLNQLNLLR